MKSNPKQMKHLTKLSNTGAPFIGISNRNRKKHVVWMKNIILFLVRLNSLSTSLGIYLGFGLRISSS